MDRCDVIAIIGEFINGASCMRNADDSFPPIPLEVKPNASNLNYLKTKKEKLGHILELV